MRRWVVLVASTLVVVLLAAAGVWWALRPDDPPDTPACPYPVVSNGTTPAVPSGDNRTTIAAASGGAVTVTETGFTQTAGGREVSIGAIVENTSSQVAYRTRVIFGAFVDDGSYALVESGRYNQLYEIPIIRPGEHAVIGTYAFVDRASFNRTGVWITVAQARLDLVRTEWVPESDTGTFPAVNARLDPNQPPRAEDGAVTVHLAASSNACRNLGGRGMTMVFRDATGAVVGGAFDGIRKTELCAAGDFTSQARVFDSKLPAADLARTEVNVYCDLTPSSYLPPGPTQPVN